MNYFFSHLALVLMLFNLSNVEAQVIKDSWVPVTFEQKLIYIDLSEIKSFKGDDIYVWAIEFHNPPIEIEAIDKDIYQTRTYYLINKKLLKYSIRDIIYYDKKINVLKNYSYEYFSDDADYKFSSPIFKGSLVELILNRCLMEIEG